MKGFQGIYQEYLPKNTFEDINIPLFVAATDILKGEIVHFSTGNLSQALKASACTPLVFQPIDFNNALYLDGGVINNFPTEPLINKCEIIIGSYVNSIKKEVDEVHMINILDCCFHLAMKNSVQNKIESCTLYIEPPNMSQFSVFNLKKSDEIYDYGYKYTLFLEKELKELINSS